MSPLLVQSKAADLRRDRCLIRSLPSRSSSREGGKVVELDLRRPCAADDEGRNADTDADNLFGLSFKASLLWSMPPPIFGSLDNQLCGDLAGDLKAPLGKRPITTWVTIFPDCPVRTPAEGIGNRPKRRHRQLFLELFKIIGVYHSGNDGDAAARDPLEVSRCPLPLVTPRRVVARWTGWRWP
jgi:hypothetical protein